MKPKTINISYWVVTGFFALGMTLTAIPTEAGKEVMATLGYPAYLLKILFVAKVLGAIALIQPWLQTIKEWAYASFTIDFIGASVSGMVVSGDPSFIYMPLLFWAIMLLSYFLWKQKLCI